MDAPHQQKLSTFGIAIVVLVANKNTLEELQPLMPKVVEALQTAERGRVTVVGSDTGRPTGR